MIAVVPSRLNKGGKDEDKVIGDIFGQMPEFTKEVGFHKILIFSISEGVSGKLESRLGIS